MHTNQLTYTPYDRYEFEMEETVFENRASAAAESGLHDIRIDGSEEFSIEFASDTMFIFLDDDEGAITLSMDEEEDGRDEEMNDTIAHFLEKTRKYPMIYDDLEDISLCE